MRLSTLAFVTFFSVSAAAQNVAARVEQLTTDVANLKNAKPAASGTLASGAPIQVKSSAGTTLATVGPDSGGHGQLEVNDAQGRTMVRTNSFESGGVVALFNKTGKGVVVLNVTAQANAGSVSVRDASGEKMLASVTTLSDGASGAVSVTGPLAQFQVNGNVHDYAEVFDVADRGGIRPGSVVAEAPDGHGLLLASGDYNSAVVGVIAGAGEFHSGMVIGSRDDGTTDLPVATGGQVFVRVCPEAGPIAVGDLLVSSGTPGVAMRGADPNRLTGTVFGKALQPFAGEGEGLIRMLVLNR